MLLVIGSLYLTLRQLRVCLDTVNSVQPLARFQALCFMLNSLKTFKSQVKFKIRIA